MTRKDIVTGKDGRLCLVEQIIKQEPLPVALLLDGKRYNIIEQGCALDVERAKYFKLFLGTDKTKEMQISVPVAWFINSADTRACITGGHRMEKIYE